MDPYEILGIRPNAGRDEIELAYKGRRSQYHPDRYAQSDAQTQAWATGKMQELNQAYAVLKDGAERSRFDQEQRNRAPKPEAPVQASPPPMSLKQVLQGYECTTEPFQKIFIAPNIPKSKLAGAVLSYGGDVRTKDVVVLIDDTMFGGAKEGVLITEKEILFKAIFESASSMRLERVKEVSAEGNRVYINGYEFAKLNIPEKRDVKALFERIDAYLKQRTAEPVAQHASSEDQQSGCEDPDEAAGEQLFFRLRQGFFQQQENEIKQESTSARSRNERASAELIRQFLRLSGVLERFVQGRGMPLSSAERSFLSSDPMRVELLIFAGAIAQHLLSKEAGMEEEQIAEVINPVLVRMLMAYIAEVEGIGERRTLRSIARPMEELEESMFFKEFRRRWHRYGLALDRTAEDIIGAFDHSVKHPAAFYALDIPLRAQLHAFAQAVMGRALDADAMEDFMPMIFKETEEVLVSVLDEA